MSAASESKIIIVDDDEAIRDSLRALLEARGFEVRAFASGPELLAALDPACSGCLLLDIRMPAMDGLEVQKALSERGSALAVVMMTAHGDVPMAVRAMKAGAADFLEKPLEPELLLSAVRLALRRAPGRAPSAVREDVALVEQRLAQLTQREREVLDRLVAGRSNKVIAYELDISPRTVEMHRARVMQKMEAQSLSQLVRMALALGIEPA
jgi:two-component system response regulator FixJ